MDKVPFEGGKISFTVVTEDSYCSVDPISGDYFKIGVNIKSYFKDKGYFSGTINDESGYPASDEFKQATYEAVNAMRDKYSTDWGYFVFAVPDGEKGRQHAWEEPGLYLLYEDLTQPAYPWVTAHETLHMFGAGDLYVDDPKTVEKVNRCQLAVGGLYDKASVYCELQDGYESMMGSGMRDATKPWREQILTTTAEQMSLIVDTSGVYRPLKDKYRQSYVLNDYNFKSEGGIILTGDVIRKNGKLTVEISGQSKMNPFYSPHGPNGDANTVVGSDHILPGNNFSCCVGHWISIDGSQSTPWFYVGFGGTYTAPFTAYFCWNVNDKKGGFGDNSGNMTVTLITSFRDNYGSAYIYKASRAIGADCQMVEPTEFDILSEYIPE